MVPENNQELCLSRGEQEDFLWETTGLVTDGGSEYKKKVSYLGHSRLFAGYLCNSEVTLLNIYNMDLCTLRIVFAQMQWLLNRLISLRDVTKVLTFHVCEAAELKWACQSGGSEAERRVRQEGVFWLVPGLEPLTSWMILVETEKQQNISSTEESRSVHQSLQKAVFLFSVWVFIWSCRPVGTAGTYLI